MALRGSARGMSLGRGQRDVVKNAAQWMQMMNTAVNELDGTCTSMRRLWARTCIRGISNGNERGGEGDIVQRNWRRGRSSAAADERDMMTGAGGIGAAAGGGIGGGGIGFGKITTATATAMVPIQKKENAGMFVDTLALMKRFMRGGLSEDQAEEVTLGVQHVLRDAMDCYMERFVSNEGFQRVMSDCETRQEYEIMSVRRENDRLRNELEKLRAELKHEVDKISSSNRLDINLEKGRMREEISVMESRRNESEIRLDREVNNLRTHVEQTKNDIIKYSMGFLVSISAVGLGLIRLLI